MCDDIYEHTQEAIQAVPHERPYDHTIADLQAKISARDKLLREMTIQWPVQHDCQCFRCSLSRKASELLK